MKWYWIKIALGALLIFVVGFAGISAVRATKQRVTRVAESSSDISIPLPFVPFTVDGVKSGTFRKLVFHRDDPHRLKGIDIVVRLSDPALLAKLDGCALTVDNPTNINANTTFRCAAADSSLEDFGQVIIESNQGAEAERIPFRLVIPKRVVADLRGKSSGAAAEKLQADRFRELGDSLAALGQALGQARSDSVREAIQAEMDDLQSEMGDVREAIVEAAQARAKAVIDAKLRVMEAPKAEAPPKPPEPPR